ncbi:hypothetical protein BDV26DRAFT_251474 [Aspergillus bertholletiae]|uniref:Uncharacterized protein n=1 Tax=Aspergillus bertholletiae TaxID=1226010 RepID=A0A5N7BPD8_9EURO|nr:hypothetical protein BDV26DRAFT_251474 [Aspergillus bertholletiae]
MLVPHPQDRIVPFLCTVLSVSLYIVSLCLPTRYISGSKMAPPPTLCFLCAKFSIHEIVSKILQ